jgi:hypothetical protein
VADWIEAALMMQRPDIVDVVVHLEPAGHRHVSPGAARPPA